MNQAPQRARREPIRELAGHLDRRWVLTGALVAINTVTLVVVPYLRPDPLEPLSVLQYIARAAWVFLGLPVAMFLYYWVPNAISSLIPELKKAGVLRDRDGDDVTLDSLADDIRDWIGSALWPVIGVLAVAGSFVVVGPLQEGEIGATSFRLRLLAVLGAAPAVYAGTVMLCRLVVGTVTTARAVGRAEPRVIPIHGDDAGGWGGFGQRFFVLARAGAVYGFVFILFNVAAITAEGSPSTSLASLSTLVYYVILPPLVVWAWFYAPHKAMLRARVAELAGLSEAFETAASLPRQMPRLDKDPVARVRVGSDLLEELVRRRNLIAAAYPGWPLRLVELRAVWATALLPVVTAVVTAIAGIIAGSITAAAGVSGS